MVMEPSSTNDISVEYPQQSQQVDSTTSKNQFSKTENIDPSAPSSKRFPQIPDGAGGAQPDQYKNIHQQRQFADQNMQRQSMYPDSAMAVSGVEQSHYPQPGVVPGSNSTPTLNQLLTQNSHPPKYSNPGYGDYIPGSGGPTNAQTMYDSWNGPQQHPISSGPSGYSNTMSQVRPSMPHPSRAIVPNSMQMGSGGSMYDRSGQPMHQQYRHPNPQFGPQGGPGFRAMAGPLPHHQGYPPHSLNPAMEPSPGGAGEGEMDGLHSAAALQRARPSMMGSGRMGPPRAPHQMDLPGGQMMPPPNQSPGYPGMHPYGNQQFRSASQMAPYNNYPSSQVSSQMTRGQPQSNFSQGPINHQPMTASQLNGPQQHKPMPPAASQPLNQPSPGAGGGSMRGISPAPNPQQIGLAPSPGQTKTMSPCPSPSVGSHRSMPPSPASVAQLNSPHPGLSPRPESVSSPRTDIPIKPDQQVLNSHPIASLPPQQQPPPNIQQQLPGNTNQQQPGDQSDPQQQHGQPHPQQMMPPQQMGGQLIHQQQPPQTMGNGMSPYQQRMPNPYQQPHRPVGPGYPGMAQYPPNHNPQQMGGGYPSSQPNQPGQGMWLQQQGQPMPSGVPGVMFPSKNDKSAVPSPLSAAQSPAATASPHGSEGSGRRSNKKSDSGSKSQKPVPLNTVHGTSMDVFNKQVELGPELPVRKQFMEHLCAFYLENSKPLLAMPSIGKNPLDLYKVYMMVKEKGGFQKVCKSKLWKQVGTATSASTAANAAYTLKKAYIKFLLNYECKFERNGIDPQVVLSSIETKKDRQNKSVPSPGSSSNSQDAAHMRPGVYPDYGMGPGVHHPGHPAHMGAGGPMRPGPYHDPNMPPHQQHGYMNYNSMGGPQPSGMPNGHHPMPPHQPGSIGPDDQQHSISSSQGDPNSADLYRQQQMGPQYNNQQPMSGQGYQHHPYYGTRMPPPVGQRPPFHPQSSQSPGLPPQQHQPGGPPGSQMRLPHPQPGYPPAPMYRGDSSYTNSQPSSMGAGPPAHPAGGGYPSMDSQPSRMPSAPPPVMYPQSSAVGATPSQISTGNMMNHNNMPHSSPATPIPRYPHQRSHFQTPTRGALSAMLSNSSATPGLDTPLTVGLFSESLSSSLGYEGIVGGPSSLEMPPPPLPLITAADHPRTASSSSQHDPRTPSGPQWRQRAPMPPPGYAPSGGVEHMTRRQLPMMRHAAPPKKEIVFPPGSVEATKPSKTQRKVLRSKDIGKIDPWKLVMCLRSGLLCESIWALDTITVLLHDDNTMLYFSLSKMPGLLRELIAHYKQSLAQLFEELSDLTESSYEGSPKSLDHEDYDLACQQVMLQKTNYSWTARNGMRVIIDTDLKKGHMIPSPSMYSRKAYKSLKTGCVAITSFETESSNEFYIKQFRKHIKPDKKSEEEGPSIRPSSANDQKDDMTTTNSPMSSPISAGTVSSAFSSHHEKRSLPDSIVFGECNGCMNGDLKTELSEHSTESTDVMLTKPCNPSISKLTDTPVTKPPPPDVANPAPSLNIKSESSIEQKTAESALDLEELEAKLSQSRKRRFSETIDIEPTIRDSSALEFEVDRHLEEISVRCITLANIIRGLSFIPANEKLMAEDRELLSIFGRLLNLRLHVDSKKDKRCWWWSTLETLREHTLVSLSNVSGHVQLIGVPHEICFPLLDSLLFWCTTTAAYARDPLPHTLSLCLRNLVLEVLCKMCAHSDNMHLLLATPPYDRISKLFQTLAKLLSDSDQVRREFALVIVSCLTQADPVAARGLAVQPSCISQLISILESAEAAAYTIAQQRGVGALRENPEAMGTSLDMIRRTSATLVEMAQVEENHSILLRQQDRLLNLVMSQILDQHVAKMLSDVLYECTKDCQLNIEPTYIVSDKTEPINDGETKMDDDEDEVKVEPTASTQEQPVGSKSAVSEIKSEPELDKENINKSAMLESNSTMGVITAAS